MVKFINWTHFSDSGYYYCLLYTQHLGMLVSSYASVEDVYWSIPKHGVTTTPFLYYTGCISSHLFVKFKPLSVPLCIPPDYSGLYMVLMCEY